MARRKTRVKDKWREKKWITVFAPDSLQNKAVGYVPITDDEKASGRVIEVTMAELEKSPEVKLQQYKVYFQIDKVTDDTATSIFKQYEYAKEYLRSLVRRGSSKVNFIIDVKTKDGYVFRLKIIALTKKLLNTSRKHRLRLKVKEVIENTVSEMTIDQFVQATCYEKINSDLMAALKRLITLRHVGLEKVKLIRTADEQIALLQA